MLDVRRLRVLRAVAQQGSFSAAADALSYTQSAVSQQIAALEREAGTLLVQRNARGVRLTDAGTALLRHTEVILSRLADAEAELEAIAGPALRPAAAGRVPLRGRDDHAEGDRALPRGAPGMELTLQPAEPDEVGRVPEGGRLRHRADDRRAAGHRRAGGRRPRASARRPDVRLPARDASAGVAGAR